MVDQKNVLQSIGARQTGNVFRPVNCTEQDMKRKRAIPGYLYFTQDSHKIYQGLGSGEYQMVGGSSSIFYGKYPMTDDEKYGTNVFFTFSMSEHIEGENVPALDSLILNIPDGGFYRVLNVDGDAIAVERLAMSGGGGNGSAGPGSNQKGNIAIEYYNGADIDTNITILNGVEHWIEFTITATDEVGDVLTETGTASWSINGKTYTQSVTTGYNKFRVDELLPLAKDGNYTRINLMVYMNTGGITDNYASKQWNIQKVDLRLEWPFTYSEDEYRKDSTFTLVFKPFGGINCTAHITFDNGSTLGQDYFEEDIPANRANGNEFTTQAMKSLPYGEHTCSIYLDATINEDTGKPITVRTQEIVHRITFTEGGTSTILTVPFDQKTATQYDTIEIPFLVYDPDTTECSVTFSVNDNVVSTRSYNRDKQSIPYTITTHGTIKLALESTNGDTKREFNITVEPLDLNREEVSGAAFNLKAINFSGNDEVINWVGGSATKPVRLNFSDNFDWRNGGLKYEVLADGSIEKFICVRQGTWMEIDYKLFEDFKTGTTGGKNFKFCFKAANCYDYEAPVLSCIHYNYNEIELTEDTYRTNKYYTLSGTNYIISRNPFDETATYFEKVRVAEIGLEFDAQKATFSSATYPNFATQYCENSYIEVETEIWPNVGDRQQGSKTVYGDRYLMIWVDGVPAGAKPYSQNMALQQNDAQTIRIGSDSCDVYVYTAKAYERRLTNDEHLNNFVMDAPSVNKMLERHRRNDIIDSSTGEISYELLVQKNPGCHAYLYDIPELTTNKEDKIDGCTYYELINEYDNLGKPFMRADKVRTYVQGTSSAAYGVAAFNLRSDFTKKGKIYDKNGNEIPGWRPSDEDEYIDIACTKVNVASCENANNVVNAEWYNKFQPYWDAHRRKGTRYDSDGNLLYNPMRDCMRFHSGVVFLRDHNTQFKYLDENGDPKSEIYLESNAFINPTNPDWEKKYAEEPYFKMYSIGNMGNDKKNLNVFHDITNPRAACVEVLDNQNAEHWMTIFNNKAFEKEVVGQDEEGKDITKGPYYEFRYGLVENEDLLENEEGITVAQQEQDFLRLAEWFATNDPSPYDELSHPNGYTGEELPEPVTFTDDFVFAGFDPPGYENQPNPTEISLKGQRISRYKGTYTHDTKNYRIAKMLYECENYLVMDSIVFHYLYISRHTMVDNVAKNTFWSTEDGLHWDLTKNYDNDTSDGNDNTGNLTYTYGLEVGDINPNGKDVFNASPSVWLNFVHELREAQQYLFQELSKKGAWDADDYLNEFKAHQDIIPEICWIQDYERKYIRPRRLGLDETTFLSRLEGGRKTHQRKQYETYQEFYLNSKYVASTAFTDSAGIEFRFNKDGDFALKPTDVLPMTFYIDCYGTIHLGGQKRTSTRIKRGNYYNAPVGELISAASDATCYIYGASMIQTIKDLYKLYPGYAKMTNASKLREFEIGSDIEGYYNPRLSEVSVGTNAMLQKFQARNVGNPENISILSLTNATQLESVLMSGSAFKELSLAPNATTKELELNPLAIFSATNLLDLETVRFDDGIYDSIQQAYINNCPGLDVYTYRFAKAPSLTNYQFTDVNWVINDETEDDFVLDTDGNVVAFAALENLTDTNTGPRLGTTTVTALSGTLTIDKACAIDEYKIYKTYAKTYPNLIFKYTDNVGSNFNPAVELIFLTNEDSEEQYYRVLGSGDTAGDNAHSIAYLTSAQGPLGFAIGTPHKESTSSHDFAFTGYWIHKKDNVITKYYNVKDLPEGATPDASAISFENKIPTENMTFYPEYITTDREYKVRFCDWAGNIILQDGQEYWPVPYGKTYVEAEGPMTNFHYRDNQGLQDHMRWAFQGWSKNQYKDKEIKNPVYEDLATMVVTNDVTLHGHYLTEDCRDVASKLEYFNFSERGKISIAEEYRDTLQGKITLPSEYDGIPLTQVKDFKNMARVTHVFFLRTNTSYTSIFQQAFEGALALQYVDLPIGITHIGTYAFKSIKSLTTVDMKSNVEEIGSQAFYETSINLTSLPAKLKLLKSGAFMDCRELTLSTLPASLETIESHVFFLCPKISINQFGGGDAKLSYIGMQAFGGGSGTNGTVTDIYFGSTVNFIGSDAFKGYGKNGRVSSISFAKQSVEDYLMTDTAFHTGISTMGFDNPPYTEVWDWKGEGS